MGVGLIRCHSSPVDMWGLLWVTWVGLVPHVVKNRRCKRSVGGAQVTCVEAMGVYENGTYMYNGILCNICCRSPDFEVGVYLMCAEMRVH